MRRELWIAAILLPLGGCYAPADPGYAQPGYGYGQPGYAQPGYPPPGYPAGGYAPSPYDQGAPVYPGYSYNGGEPTYVDGGVSVPLVFFGGEWGFYDHERHWHHAPDRVSHDLEAHRAGGGQFHPNAVPRGESNFQPRPGQPGGQPDGRAVFRPGEQPRLAPPQAAFRPTEPPRPAPPAAPFRPAAAAPAAPAPQQHHEEHGRGRDCPPGQRC
jgi:hypothetical protein